MKKAVTVIPATILKHTPAGQNRKRRVAAYARVSTDHDEQQTSYSAQIDYYANYIESREDWEFVCVYTDEGISATSTAKRTGFNKMVADALAGKIDLIVTKSVSRFARNTVDSLSTIRKLKENGTEVFFEKESIWTFDSKGELLITIMSSLAQEESRSISENVTWGLRKRMQDGKISMAYSRFLGYDKGENGTLIVNEKEAGLVRFIFKMFLDGGTPHSIAKYLSGQGIPSPTGKTKWSAVSIKYMLTNEKYRGDALLQKSYTVDFLSKKTKRNEGEAPQYYVEQAHPAIIAPAVFELVQQEYAKRKTGATSKNRHSSAGIFASKIKCGDCGGWYGAKLWHSNSKYRRRVYQCNHKATKKCATPHCKEGAIKQKFIAAVNKLLTERDEVIANLAEIMNAIFDTSALETERAIMESELNATAKLMQKCTEESRGGIEARHKATQARLDAVSAQISDAKARVHPMESFIAELKKQDGLIAEFDEDLWINLIDHAIIRSCEDMRFVFKDGAEMQISSSTPPAGV